MNKKRIGLFFMAALVVTLGLSLIDFGKPSLSHEEIIGEFVGDNLEEKTTYRPILIKRIDESMLLTQPAISEAYSTIVDSIGNQLQLLSNDYISLDFQNQLQLASNFAGQLNLQNLRDYLPLDAQLKRIIKKEKALGTVLQARLYHEESRMHEAINELNTALSDFNLSVFSLDFDENSNPMYWHQYELSNELVALNTSRYLSSKRRAERYFHSKMLKTQADFLNSKF